MVCFRRYRYPNAAKYLTEPSQETSAASVWRSVHLPQEQINDDHFDTIVRLCHIHKLRQDD